MSLFQIFDVSASAMNAQSVRLNTTASNLANAESVSSSAEQTYRARRPVFAAQLQGALGDASAPQGVEVKGIVESQVPLVQEYNPSHPMADMISASRSYQTNVQVADTAKNMLTQTLRLGKG